MVSIRAADMTDAPLLLLWRNDPQTRANSHTTGEIALADHMRWLQATLADPNRALRIAQIDGEPVGMVRADRDADGAELSWAIAPSARGRGVGSLVVRAFVRMLSGPLRAEVKAGNVPSIRIAAAAGMRMEREHDGVLYFTTGPR